MNLPSSPDLIRFDEFMSMALYGPAGFYSSGGRAGRRGDFITSPEVGPLFGAVLSRRIDAEWRRQGEPDVFDVIEVGAGPGTLARSIAAARSAVAQAGALRYTGVETSSSQRTLHPEGITSLESMPSRVRNGMVVGNELLDNLPFRLAVWDDGWREAYVTERGGKWVEVLLPFDVLPPSLPVSGVPHGARAPVQDAAASWVRDALALLDDGCVLVFDYCVGVTAELALRPWREWLRTYRQQQRGVHYLNQPGTQDITTEVCVDQLILAAGEPDSVRSQAQWLSVWGIDELVAEGRQWWEEKSSAPDLRAMTGRSRVREAEALCDPSGLGSFTVLEWTTTRS